MRSQEEIRQAAVFMRDYADRIRARFIEDGMAPQWDTDTSEYDLSQRVNKLRLGLSRVHAAENIADCLENNHDPEIEVRTWLDNLGDTPTYLGESGDSLTFWFEFRIEVNFNNWLLGHDWPKYCRLFRFNSY